MAPPNNSTPVATTGLRFDDEFNSFSSSTDGNSGTWMTTYAYSGENAYTLTPNGEGEYYGQAGAPNSPFSLSNGVLDITASKAAPGSNPYGLPYTSGLITTHNSYAQTYGYFETRVEMPAGQGLWPAFWMLPVNPHDATELDIFEMLGNNPSTIFSTTHGANGSGVGQALTVPDTSAGFHTYGVDWKPDTITFYMDGAKIATTATPASMNQPMYMLLNLAVGGTTSWPGAPSAATRFPSTMQVDYVRAYSTAATTTVSGSAAMPLPPPGVTPPLVAPPPPPETAIGTGPDLLSLQVSEDAWQGDAQYTVSVDGHQIGGVQIATAQRATGSSQRLDISGAFGPGTHTATVNFLNDAWGGTPQTDRNLFVESASSDGMMVNGGSLAEYSGGAQSFTFQGPAVARDTLTLGVSEDAWQGDAQYTVSVDGTRVGGTYTAIASHAAGQVGTQVLGGNWGAGPHAVSIAFINDGWGGTPQTDRNLYINSVAYDGTKVAMGTLEQANWGSTTVTTPAVPAPIVLTLHLAEDAWQGDAQFTVAIDGKQVNVAQPVTASRAAGATQDFKMSVLGSGAHDIAVSFINDAWGGSPQTDRNLFVIGADMNGASLGPSWSSALYSNGTAHFNLTVPSPS